MYRDVRKRLARLEASAPVVERANPAAELADMEARIKRGLRDFADGNKPAGLLVHLQLHSASRYQEPETYRTLLARVGADLAAAGISAPEYQQLDPVFRRLARTGARAADRGPDAITLMLRARLASNTARLAGTTAEKRQKLAGILGVSEGELADAFAPRLSAPVIEGGES